MRRERPLIHIHSFRRPPIVIQIRLYSRRQKQFIDNALQLEDSEVEAALLHTIHYRSPIPRHRLGLIEVCTPTDSSLADRVIKRGGKAERRGLHNADLSNNSTFAWARQRAALLKPRHMWFSPPCTMFSQMQNSHLWHKTSDFGEAGVSTTLYHAPYSYSAGA